MPLDEVDDCAEADAVDDVAECAAEHQGERQRESEFVAMAAEQDDDPAGNAEGHDREEPALPAACVGEKTESGAGVEGQHPVPERRDIARLAELEGAEHHPFAGLVEQDDQPGHP